jgi:hypothetical protein
MRMVSTSASIALTSCAVSSPVLDVAGFSTMFWHSFFESWQKTISSLVVFPKILPDVLSLPRRSHSFKSRFLMPLLHSRLTSLPERPSFLGTWYSLVLAFYLTRVSFRPYRNGTVCQPSLACGQLLPGPTIVLGLFLWLIVAPYG